MRIENTINTEYYIRNFLEMINAYCENIKVENIFIYLQNDTNDNLFESEFPFMDNAISFNTTCGKHGSIMVEPLDKEKFEFIFDNKKIAEFNSYEIKIITPFRNTDLTVYFSGLFNISNTISHILSNSLEVDKRILNIGLNILENLECNLMSGLFSDMPIERHAVYRVDYISPYLNNSKGRMYYNIIYDAVVTNKTVDFYCFLN